MLKNRKSIAIKMSNLLIKITFNLRRVETDNINFLLKFSLIFKMWKKLFWTAIVDIRDDRPKEQKFQERFHF